MFKSLFNQNKESQFWKWFAQHESDFYDPEDKEEEVYSKLGSKLRGINDNLVFAIGPKEKTGARRLAISADGILEAFPSVIKLVKKAPDFVRWKVCAFRQRLEGDDLEVELDNDLRIGYSDIFFKYSFVNNQVGLILAINNFDDSNNALKDAVFILLDGLIGEYDAETKIAWIEWEKLQEEELDKLFPFVDLRSVVDSIAE